MDLPTASRELADGLAYFDEAETRRQTQSRPVPNPPIKSLVRKAEPLACVRRTATGLYECYIGQQRITAMGCQTHATPLQAWACLARYIAARKEVC